METFELLCHLKTVGTIIGSLALIVFVPIIIGRIAFWIAEKCKKKNYGTVWLMGFNRDDSMWIVGAFTLFITCMVALFIILCVCIYIVIYRQIC